jgi:beta-glucanase (GH16 family)
LNATATWTPRLRSQGPVRVSLYVIAHSNNVANARVELAGAGKTNTVTVNMRADVSQWTPVGTIEFAGQGKEFVRVRPGGPGNLRLSALRLEVLDARDGMVWQTLVLDDLFPYDPAKLRREASREIRPGPSNPEQWELTFSDDFNGDRLDANVWKSAQGQTWGQLQSIRYPENAQVTNGLLRLITRKEKRGGKEWTSAMISTRHFRQRYGYWESRYRYAAATGLNQAFWMNPGSKAKAGSFENDVALDASFEIDVNEGHYPTDVNATLHQGGLPSKSKRYVTDYDLSADFHIYAADWNEREVVYFFDGREVHRVPNAKAHLEAPVIYSTAVLPWAGPITDALDGKSMDVDWVRVYQRKADQ